MAMRARERAGEDLVVELAETFRLMSDPTRLKIILACLDAPDAYGRIVSDFLRECPFNPSTNRPETP